MELNQMHRYLLAAIVSLTALSAQAADAIVPFQHTTGATLTMEITTSATADISVPEVTEGTGDGVTWYRVDSSDIVDAGLSTAGDYGFVILEGSTVIREGVLHWSGTVALPQPVNATQFAGTAYASAIASWIDLVWDEATSGHATAGTTGKAIADATATATPDTRDLAEVPTWKLKRSGSGSLGSSNILVLHPGDTVRHGWDCDIQQILPGSTVLATMTTPTDENADTTLTKLGIDPKVAKVEIAVDADAEATDDPLTTDELEGFWVSTAVTNSNGGGPITVYGYVVIQDALE